jgi:hypothetical protein
LPGLFFDLKCRGNMFLWNVSWLSTDYRQYILEARTLQRVGTFTRIAYKHSSSSSVGASSK